MTNTNGILLQEVALDESVMRALSDAEASVMGLELASRGEAGLLKAVSPCFFFSHPALSTLLRVE